MEDNEFNPYKDIQVVNLNEIKNMGAVAKKPFAIIIWKDISQRQAEILKDRIEEFLKGEPGIKSKIEIEEKYEELNQRMQKNIPKEKDIQELINYGEDKTKKDGVEILVKMLSRSTDSISIDAQRYAIEWVMKHHE